MEELGIKIKKPRLVEEFWQREQYPNGMTDNELNQLFTARFGGKMRFKDGEVQQGRFVEPKELLKQLEENSELFTPWILQGRGLLQKLFSKRVF